MIRRAQGADLFHGCVYMDQLKRVASRGYAYVACSRFKSKSGCYLYGRLRVSDFLPVGLPREDEITERGAESQSSDSEDGSRAMHYPRVFVPESDEEGPPVVEEAFGMHDFG